MVLPGDETQLRIKAGRTAHSLEEGDVVTVIQRRRVRDEPTRQLFPNRNEKWMDLTSAQARVSRVSRARRHFRGNSRRHDIHQIDRTAWQCIPRSDHALVADDTPSKQSAQLNICIWDTFLDGPDRRLGFPHQLAPLTLARFYRSGGGSSCAPEQVGQKWGFRPRLTCRDHTAMHRRQVSHSTMGAAQKESTSDVGSIGVGVVRR